MARVARNNQDPRTRYTHNAVMLSYGGIPPERGPSGRNMLLPMTMRGAFMFEVAADIASAQIVGDIPYGVWIDGFVKHQALTSGTYSLILKGVGGGGDDTLIAAGASLTTAGLVTLTNSIFVPLVNNRPLQMTISGGTAGERGRFSLLATPAEVAWK
jgi:hypothetical protein